MFNLYGIMLDSSFRDLSNRLSVGLDRDDQTDKYDRWTSLVKQTLDKLPYMDKLLTGNVNCVFGSFLQTVYENLELSPDQLIELHFITLKKDLDIRSFIDHVVYVFRDVYDKGGSVEFAGTPYCTKVSRMGDKLKEFSSFDINKSIYGLPKGNYWIYIKHNNSWIKYDLSYQIDKPDIRLDFVANGLIYPCTNDVERAWNISAMIDIDAKRIVPIQEIMTPKLMFRGTKLLSKGYQFADTKHLERMVSRKKKAYYPGTVLFKSTVEPSVEPTERIIYATKHKFVNPNRMELPEYYAKFVVDGGCKICGPSFAFAERSWSRECTGITTNVVSVYRAAVISNKGSTLRWLSFKDIDSDDQYAVVIQLQVPIHSKFESENYRTCIAFKFDADNIEVKDIFGYYNKSIFDQVMSTLTDTPFSMKKHYGRITTKSDDDNFLYISTAWGSCTGLKLMVNQ